MNKKFTDDNDQYYYGFYRGYVENNGYGDGESDEEDRNRIQVRVAGVHTQKTTEAVEKEGIPLEHLPWAEQAGNIFGGFGPSKGGISTNKPVYFASIIGEGDRDLDQDDNVHVIKSKLGHKITISDDEDDSYVEVKTQDELSIKLDDEDQSIKIEDKNTGNNIFIETDGITIEATAGNGDVTILTSEGDIIITPSTGKIEISNTSGNLKDIISNVLTSLQNLQTPGNLLGNLGIPVVGAVPASDLASKTVPDQTKLPLIMK